MKKFNLFSIPLFFLSISSFAQLTAWKNEDAISILNTSKSAQNNYQVLITLDTKSKIASNKMKADGSDIRFTSDCAGTTLLTYYIDSGINTQSTRIWVKIPSLAINENKTIYMFYNNSAATAVSDFAGTFPNSHKVTGAEIIQAGTEQWDYDWVEIPANAIVTFDPQHDEKFTIKARNIIINGIFKGDSLGYKGGINDAGNGPGGGGSNPDGAGAGGAGYGGDGGIGSWCCDSNTISPGGLAYGESNDLSSIEAGSGGGASIIFTGVGGNGGMGIRMEASYIGIGGTVSCNGSAGSPGFGSAGGGSGGGILILGTNVSIGGNLFCNGGNGGSQGYGGGGGAGGRIKIGYQDTLLGGNKIYVRGGQPGADGSEPGTAGKKGTIFKGKEIIGQPVVVIGEGLNPTIEIRVSETNICQGTAVSFLALAGNGGSSPAFQWKKNGVNIPNETNANFSTTDIANGDQFSCELISNAACISQNIALSESISIKVDEPITASYITDRSEYVINDPIKFFDVSTNALAWFWDFGDGSATSTLQNVTHTYDNPGNFLLTHIAYRGFCSDTIMEFKTVNEFVGVHQTKNNHICKIYPSPASTEFILKSSGMQTGSSVIKVYSTNGSLLYADKINNNTEKKINCMNWANGIYFLQLQNDNAIENLKMIKQ